MSDNKEYCADALSRVCMRPDSARVVVELKVSVECGSWGQDCTVAQAVKQATQEAERTLADALKDTNIRILAATGARVVCDAKKDY